MIANNKISDIQHWVEEQMIRGRYMFTKQDVLDLGLPIKDVSVNKNKKYIEFVAQRAPSYREFVQDMALKM